MPGIGSTHHDPGIEHMPRQFWHGRRAVLLRTADVTGEVRDEEMEAREGNEGDDQFPQIAIQLVREPDARPDSTHRSGHEMVQISVGGGHRFQSPETDVVQGFVVQQHALVGVLDELEAQDSVVRLKTPRRRPSATG